MLLLQADTHCHDSAVSIACCCAFVSIDVRMCINVDHLQISESLDGG